MFCLKMNSQTFLKSAGSSLIKVNHHLAAPSRRGSRIRSKESGDIAPTLAYIHSNCIRFKGQRLFSNYSCSDWNYEPYTDSRDAQCDGQQRTGCYSAGAALHGDPGTQTAVVQRQTGTAVACPGVLRPPKATTTFANFDRTGSPGRGALDPFVCAACCVTAPSDHAFRVLQNRK